MLRCINELVKGCEILLAPATRSGLKSSRKDPINCPRFREDITIRDSIFTTRGIGYIGGIASELEMNNSRKGNGTAEVECAVLYLFSFYNENIRIGR